MCRIEAGLCVGCGRTLDEIGAWSTATADEQRRIVAHAEARLGMT